MFCDCCQVLGAVIKLFCVCNLRLNICNLRFPDGGVQAVFVI
jgi:hypothetical protein